MSRILLFGLLLSLAPLQAAWAQSDIYQDFGDYRVYYSVFNTSEVPPEVAELYGITRSRDTGLVNIALVGQTAEGQTAGRPAEVSGHAQDLMQRRIELSFEEVNEGEAYYYLADFDINDGDPMHFSIQVSPRGEAESTTVEFTRTLNTD